MDWNRKNVVYVGGLGGIGYEACKILMNKSIASLSIFDLLENEEALNTLQSINPKTELIYQKVNLTDKTTIKSAIEHVVSKFKYIDILVNGAGVSAEHNVELTINVNLGGVINCTLEALPFMDKHRQGRGGIVVNIASTMGLTPCGAWAVYCATKYGIVGFTRSLADSHYYQLTGVCFSVLCPALTLTPMTTNINAGPTTFEFSQPIMERFGNCKSQSAGSCGQHLVQVIEQNKNDSVWISDSGNLKEVEMQSYWEPQPK